MDVTCAHCGEPWDVYGLCHDAIDYLSPLEGALLAPLGPVAGLVPLVVDRAESQCDLDRLLAGIRADFREQELTVPALFDYWCNAPAGSDDPHRQAAARLVNTAIYQGVLSGKGCLSAGCGFDHPSNGKHASHTAGEVAVDGITDDDPMLFT